MREKGKGKEVKDDLQTKKHFRIAAIEKIKQEFPTLLEIEADIEFFVDQVMKDKNYLKKLKIRKELKENQNKPIEDSIKPISKLSPGDPEYDSVLKKICESNNNGPSIQLHQTECIEGGGKNN